MKTRYGISAMSLVVAATIFEGLEVDIFLYDDGVHCNCRYLNIASEIQ
jgi:sulfur relay (sulfurtransferase) complex TusBCD TusD component (DsrE family)